MQAQQDLSELQFVNLHVVDKNYHELLMNTELPIGTISVRMALDATNKSLKEGRPVKISEVDV